VGWTGRGGAVAVCIVLALALWAAPAQAAPVSATLSASNGEGTFDPTLACPGGDGPSWSYAYSGISSDPDGPLGGTWNSTVHVHDAGLGQAYIPAGTGRVKIAVAAGGDANLEFDGGSCAFAPLSLGTQLDGDPVVSGTLPAHATGGSGVMRGFSGTGSVSFTLELGAGADNAALIGFSGDFGVLQPNLALGIPNAFWRNASDYFGRRLSVVVPVQNVGDATVSGDAFGVTLAQAKLSGRNPISGVPASFGRVNPGQVKAVVARFPNARPGRTYNVTATFTGKDALDQSLAPVIQSASVKAPPLP
jgi:hypothetical protein